MTPSKISFVRAMGNRLVCSSGKKLEVGVVGGLGWRGSWIIGWGSMIAI